MVRNDIDTIRKEPKRLIFKHVVRKIFLEDWAIKLTALLITLGLWYGVTGLSTKSTQQLKVPLNLSISSSADVTVASLQEVDIFISGDKRRFDTLIKGNLVASIDLTDIPPGDRFISLSPETVNVNLPEGITFDAVLQTRIFVKLEAVEEKDVDVKARIGGGPVSGYEVYSSSVIPQKIRVRGPASFLRTLDVVETDNIDLAKQTSDFAARQVPVSVSNPKAVVLNTVVDVYFRIGEKRVERTFAVPVTGSPGKTATLTVFGPRTLMLKTKSDAFKVEIVKSDSGGDGSPQLTLPAELQGFVEIIKVKLNP